MNSAGLLAVLPLEQRFTRGSNGVYRSDPTPRGNI
jgi:hypothetical protein